MKNIIYTSVNCVHKVDEFHNFLLCLLLRLSKASIKVKLMIFIDSKLKQVVIVPRIKNNNLVIQCKYKEMQNHRLVKNKMQI